ncbi:starch synthase [candidate division WWE3 bacterium CG08_land_8_20_14_0_20_40_13]|uniref:Glycogen synthase n=1 Tax=candidate division WWE3 bacterium CG08_land_8_20_14_0_20_40_13 TaxID=1975084 RepID=A0A2H0XEP4_UNCKA|nr:MAG: starch synthase [candidate division WWE3 bacterium CG08_land_8_20_14_0_20_40_13]
MQSKYQPIKVLMVTAETRPFASVGGQGAVVFYLTKALRTLGIDARIFMPKFGFIDEKKYQLNCIYKNLKVPTGHGAENKQHLICNVKYFNEKSQPPVYFLENMEYYELRENVYGYSDDHIRWALLGRGVLEFIKKSSERKFKESFVPDITHCHDWHSGLVPDFLKTQYKDQKTLSTLMSIFTIHNLKFQGVTDYKNSSEVNLDDGRSPVSPFFSDRLKHLNFMKRGILFSDLVTTVSSTYSKEILTPEYGEGLDRLLAEVRSKIHGIVNGIDYEDFNPKTDKRLIANYDQENLEARVENKLALQKEFSLKKDSKIPILSYVGRLDDQKGIDLIVKVISLLLKDFDIQFIQVGGGSSHYTLKFQELKEMYPEKVGIHPFPNFDLPRLVFSGSDMILMPSKFEPCGLVQVEAMRYGSIPIVRATGGLADTVENFDPETGQGTGFVFKDYSKYSFFAQIVRALETYKYKKVWKKIIANAMKSDFSWKNSAQKYADLYNALLRSRNSEI